MTEGRRTCGWRPGKREWRSLRAGERRQQSPWQAAVGLRGTTSGPWLGYLQRECRLGRWWRMPPSLPEPPSSCACARRAQGSSHRAPGAPLHSAQVASLLFSLSSWGVVLPHGPLPQPRPSSFCRCLPACPLRPRRCSLCLVPLHFPWGWCSSQPAWDPGSGAGDDAKCVFVEKLSLDIAPDSDPARLGPGQCPG